MGFFGGTALQWVTFWTEIQSSEFPIMGGAILGFVLVLGLRYKKALVTSRYVVAGVIIGNLNAYWCHRSPFDYWMRVLLGSKVGGFPQDVGRAWTHAAIAFFLVSLLTIALAALCERIISRYNARLTR
jgi:hypothetical protein